MKKILPTLAALSVTLFVGVLITHAQDYTPLAPLPIGDNGTTPAVYTFSSYIAGAIKLLIALGSGLAVLMAIIGGTQYVAAGIAPAAKNDAKDRILKAFIGLALMLTSYMILYSINPDLVNFKLDLPPITQGTGTGNGSTGGQTGSGSTGAQTANNWPDDSAIRNQLKTAGIGINKSNCTYVGQTTCTSVAELPASAVNGLINLKNTCNCAVMITGGTEAGHQTHGRGKAIVDLRYQDPLNSFIKTGRTPVNPQSGCGIRGADHYSVSGAVYDLEIPGGIHWHVCY